MSIVESSQWTHGLKLVIVRSVLPPNNVAIPRTTTNKRPAGNGSKRFAIFLCLRNWILLIMNVHEPPVDSVRREREIIWFCDRLPEKLSKHYICWLTRDNVFSLLICMPHIWRCRTMSSGVQEHVHALPNVNRRRDKTRVYSLY